MNRGSVLVALAVSTTAAAADPIDLRYRQPQPRHLAMRPRRIVAAAETTAGPGRDGRSAYAALAPTTAALAPTTAALAPTTAALAPTTAALAPTTAALAPTTAALAPTTAALAATPAAPPLRTATPTSDTGEVAPALRRSDQRLAFRFDLGFALDGAAASGEPTLSGQPSREDAQSPTRFAEVRPLGFGDVFLGSRGLVIPSITAFLSAHYRLRSDLGRPPPIAETDDDDNDVRIRSGWAELKSPSERRWLKPLRLRAGRFYIYGPWVMHVDGTTIGWDGPVVTAELTTASTVNQFTDGGRGGLPDFLTQLSVRADLTARKRKLPLRLKADVLSLLDHTHLHGELAWQPRASLSFSAEARALDGTLVHQRVALRGRFREINSVFAEIVHRNSDDWRWDPTLVRSETLDASEPRPYLELGPLRRRLTAQVRAGTVLFDNIDLLARVATASDFGKANELTTSFSAGYLELGGALEVRLRRTLAVGASLTSRATRLASTPILDTLGPAPLPLAEPYGDRGSTEGGGHFRLTLGPRTLTVSGELYARRNRFAKVYTTATSDDPESKVVPSEFHIGARVSVDAWVNRRLRVLARYEVVSAQRLAPEITGYKSLRVIVEATF